MCIFIYTKCVAKEYNREVSIYHHPENKKRVRPPESALGIRHIQCLMIFLAIAISFSLRYNISVAIVSMTQKNNSSSHVPTFEWDESMKGIVAASFYWSYPFLLIPAGPLSVKFGPKNSLVTSIFLCGALTILVPLVSATGRAAFYLITLLRILQGLAQSFLLAATSYLVSRWAPIQERGRLFYFVFSGDRIGILGTMIISGVLADSRWGWPSIFYVTGGIAILWAFLYSYLGADSPQVHKTISQSEREYILNSLPNTSHESKTMSTPWKAIWTSTPVWALTVGLCGYLWVYNTIAINTPAYLDGVFGFDIKQSGFFSSLPYVLSYVVGFGVAAINDMLLNQKKISQTKIRKLWNSVAIWSAGFGLCVLALAGNNKILTVFSLIAIGASNGAVNLGVVCNHLDLSPNFSGTIVGLAATFSCQSASLSVLVTGFVVTNTKSISQWQVVFLIGAVVSFVSNLIFLIFGTTDVQPWNDPPKKQTTS